MSREENNKLVVRQVLEEAFNQGQTALLEKLFSPHFIDRSTPDQPPGPQGVKDYFAQVHNDFPGMQIIIDDMVAEGEKVVVRTSWRGTYAGPKVDADLRGKPVGRTMIQIFRVADGKILEEWNEGSDWH